MSAYDLQGDVGGRKMGNVQAERVLVIGVTAIQRGIDTKTRTR